MNNKVSANKSGGTATEREFEVIDCFGSAHSIISEHEIIIDDLEQCNGKPDYISVKAADELTTAFHGSDESNVQTPARKEKPKPPVRTPSSSNKPEFSKENDVPDVSMKVYDFVMSKDKTIPKSLTLEEHAEIRRKFYWIGGFVLASVILVAIIVIVLCTVNTSSTYV